MEKVVIFSILAVIWISNGLIKIAFSTGDPKALIIQFISGILWVILAVWSYIEYKKEEK